MRMASVVGVLLALHAGCSSQNKKADPRLDTKDASKVETTDGRPAVPPITDEQVQRALEIMADPESKTDQGAGLEAMFLVEDWLKRGPDEAALQRTSKALERVAAEGSTFMRRKAHDLLAEYELPDAQRILITVVENPALDVSERDSAGRALGLVIDDFALIRNWLRDDQPLHWEAALAMMWTFQAFDAEAQERRWAERRTLLIELGKRPDLPGPVVYDLARWFDVYLEDDPADAEIIKLAERWSKHPDDMAAYQMEKILLSAKLKRGE